MGAPPMTIGPGTLLHDRYEIQAEVDAELPERGFRALDLRLGRRVHVRACPLPGPADRDGFTGFDQRTHALAALQHPHLQLFFDVGMLRREVFTVSEWLEGDSLADLVRDHPLPWTEARPLLSQALSGLLHAHDQGVHHLRLSSLAILRKPTGEVVVHGFSLIPDLQLEGLLADLRAFAALLMDSVTPEELPGGLRGLALGVLHPQAAAPTPSLRDFEPLLADAGSPVQAQAVPWRRAVALGLLLGAGGLAWGFRDRIRARPSTLSIRPFSGVGVGDPAVVGQLSEQVRLHLLRIRNLKLQPAGGPSDLELEGRVLREGASLQLSLALLRPGDLEPLWSQTQPATARGIGRLERDLGQKLAGLIRVENPAARPPPEAAETESTEAYQALIRARFYLGKRTPDAFRKAEEELNRSLKADPLFARSHTALAECLVLQGVHAMLPPAEAARRARASAERALDLDPGQAEALCALAYVQFRFEWDWEGARRAFARAASGDPENPLIRHWHGFFLACLGRWEEAIRELKASLELDPLGFQAQTNLGVAYCWSGRLRQGLEEFRKVLELQPAFLSAHDRLIMELESHGRIAESLAAGEARCQFDPNARPSLDQAREAFLQGGAPRFWALKAEQMAATLAASPGDPLALARPLTALGRHPEALDALERAADLHSAMMVWVPKDPALAPLRKDPRFKALLRRINFPED